MKHLVVCAALVLASCESTPEEVVVHQPTKDLTTDKQEVVAAFRAGGAEWALMREQVLDNPPLANFVVDNMIDQMLRSYNRAQVSLTGTKDGPFERAQVELVAMHKYSIPVLTELLEASVSDTVVAFLAADILRVIGPESWPSLTSKLSSNDPETRRRALAAFTEMKFDYESLSLEVDALFVRVEKLAHSDPEWLVRAEAAATLGAIGAQMSSRKPAREALTKCLLEADNDVRRSAELALGTLGDPRSFPTLIEILAREVEGGSPRNMAATRHSLVVLAREAGLEKRGRGFSIRDWQNYWRANRDRLLRARSSQEKR